MMHFAFPNIEDEETFIGCGRLVALPRGQGATEAGYRLAKPNDGDIDHVLRAARSLAPELNTAPPSVHEQLNGQNDTYQGRSLELAYLLAAICCVRRLRLETIGLSGDIWCTGRITERADRACVLASVDYDAFSAKLHAFLSPAQDPYKPHAPLGRASEDKVFFVPAQNFDSAREYTDWCTAAATRVLSLRGFADTLGLAVAHAEWPHKMVVMLRDDELSALVDLLFERPRLSAGVGPDYDLPEVWAEQASHLHTFAGRVAWLKQLEAWVAEAGDEEAEGRYFLLLGPPGQGKSALLAQFSQAMSDTSAPTAIADRAERSQFPGQSVGCLLHMVKSHKNPRRFLQFLLWQVQRLLGEPVRAAAYQGDVDDLRNALVGALAQVRDRQQRALMVIDALDELDPLGERINFLPESLPAGGRVVLSCRPDIPLVNALRRRLRRLTVADLPPLTAADLPRFLERYLEPTRVHALHDVVDFAALFQHTGGNPLFLRRAMERILDEVHRAQAQGEPVPVMPVTVFPNTAEAVFADIYTEIAEKVNSRATSTEGRQRARLMQWLTMARQPLRVEELHGLLRAAGSELELGDVRDLVLQMSKYLLADNTERFLPFHQGFTDYLHQKVLGEEGLARGHGLFCQWLSTKRQRSSDYGLRHLPAHLLEWRRLSTACDMEDEASQAGAQLTALLTDWDFVEAKVHDGMTFDLVRDYQAALAALPPDAPAQYSLNAWARFLDSDSHILAPAPHLFFQQALNQPADSPVAQAAERQFARAPRPRPYLRWLNKPEQSTPSPLVRTLTGHREVVRAVAITPDGRSAVSGSEDATLKVWELASGQEMATLMGHADEVWAVAITPDGRSVVSGGAKATLRVWDLASGQAVRTLAGHTGVLRAVAITPDGRSVVSGSEDATLKVWELASGQEMATLTGHAGGVWAVAITPDGRHVVSGGADATLRVWELASGQEVRTLAGHTGPLWAVAITPDGCHAVSAGEDTTLKVWELASGQEIVTLAGHTSDLVAVAITPDGRSVVSGSADATLKVWELASGQEMATLAGHTSDVMAVAITPDGRYAVSGSEDATLKVWELASAQQGATLTRHTSGVWAANITPDGCYVVSGGEDATLRVWELASGQEVAALTGHTGPIWVIMITPDGRYAVSGSEDTTLKVWDLASGQAVQTLAGHTGAVNSVAFTPDGRYAVSGSSDTTLKVWDLASGQAVRTLAGHRGEVWDVAVTHDGCYVVSGGIDATLRVWELASGQAVRTLTGHPGGVWALNVTPDDRYVVSGGADATLRVWELASGQAVHTLTGHTSDIFVVVITSNGRHAVSVSQDKTLKVWDIVRGEEVRTLIGHAQGVWIVALTPDGRYAVSGSGDDTLKVWEFTSGQEVRTLSRRMGMLQTVAVTPNGRYAIAAQPDKTLKVRDVASGQEVRTLAGHSDFITTVVLTPDGRYVVSGAWDKTLKVWELASGQEVATFPVAGGPLVCEVHSDGRIVCDAAGKVYMLRLEGV